MKKTVMICMAILAVALLGISMVPTVFLDQDERLVWQLDNWACIFASLLMAIIGVMLTLYCTKGKQISGKLIGWLGCIVFGAVCLFSCFIAVVKHDKNIWHNKDYVVYSEYYDFFDPEMFVLYKRDGLVDRRMHSLGSSGFGQVKKAEFTIYNDLDLIKEEADVTAFESDSVYHITVFYRLSDGLQFEQDKNDSLSLVITE